VDSVPACRPRFQLVTTRSEGIAGECGASDSNSFLRFENVISLR
jgi:hypothetical protein